MSDVPVDPDAAASRSTPRRKSRVVLAVLVVLAVAVGTYVLWPDSKPQTDDAMSARAARVMPFDLTSTAHTFTKTATGGVQEVVAKDPADTTNVGLIRSHLAVEAEDFSKGNFDDPAKIHGMDMPGLRELEAGAARVHVMYEAIPAGGRITYSSNDPALAEALHQWFDRQATDHAMPGMGG
jgi:hypothetical protein